MSDNWNVGKQKTKGIKQETEYAVLVAVSSKAQTKELKHVHKWSLRKCNTCCQDYEDYGLTSKDNVVVSV